MVVSMNLFVSVSGLGTLLAWVTCLSGGILVLQLIWNLCRLRGIDGPVLARCSDLWRFSKTYQGNMQHVYLNLHRRYGNIVRIGPNTVSLAGSDAKSVLYGISGPRFPKSNFYTPFQATIAGKPYQNLFNTTDEAFHAAIKRPVSRAYAMSTLLEYEPFVNITTENVLSQISRRYASSRTGPGAVCALDRWLQYYAYDVIGELTFSKSFGFLNLGPEADEIIAGLSPPKLIVATCQMPLIDQLVLKPLLRFFIRAPTSPVVTFTMARMKERAQQTEKEPADRRDMLSRFLHAQDVDPDFIDDLRVLSYATSNVNAGADTTAITLRAAFYYLLKNPATMQALEQEILSAAKLGTLSTPCVSWAEAQKLPYLDAVVKEALRMHPAVGLALERRVPAGGLHLYGRHLPEGTLVGISPWVIARDRSVYGEDADHWRPERWLECDPAQLNKMVGASLAFGGGARTCIGKNISLLTMYKLIPALIQMFELSLANPTEEWRTENIFLVAQKGLGVMFKGRDSPFVSQDAVPSTEMS